MRAHAEPSAWWWAAAWAGAAALLVLLKLPALREPYFWDALGCYYAQAVELARDAAGWQSSHPAYIRPPVYVGFLVAVIRGVGDTPLCLHTATVIWVALTLPVTYELTRLLGGSRGAGWLAAALCLSTPLFFAQASLVQTDMPATPLIVLAWLMALRSRWVLYAVMGGLAVLTKESSYYVCLPAMVLLYGRAVIVDKRPARSPWTLLRCWPATLPGFVLVGWLVVHKLLTGHVMASGHTQVIGTLPATLSALSHNFLEGGRVVLLMCASLLVVPLVRQMQKDRRAPWFGIDGARLELLCTALLWVALPVCFPAGLARYVAASLPPLCALAALGIYQLGQSQRTATGALTIGALIGMWHGDSWHANWGHHLEANLDYQQLLWAQREVAETLAAVAPRSVLAEFPVSHLLGAPPGAGYLPAPLRARDLSTVSTLEQVCAHDYVVISAATESELLQQAQARGYMTFWKNIGEEELSVGKRPLTPPWARRDLSLNIFRVSCPKGYPSAAGR